MVVRKDGGFRARVRASIGRARMLPLGLSILGFVAACGPDSSDPIATRVVTGKTVVVGVDGLDYRTLDREVEAGRLPNFARLYREGSVGTIDVVPLGIPIASPRIWTTFATGQLPEVHGVENFVYADESGASRLYSSDRRRSPAVWEIASELDARVGVVNWWTTYPAEEVAGFMISDRYNALWPQRLVRFFGGASADREFERAVFPPSLIASLGEVEPSGEYFVLTPESAEAIDREMFELALAAVREHPVDLLLVYTRALDELSHLHWKTHEPLAGEAPADDLIADYLERYDALLGDFLARLGPVDRLMVLSDHGFERNPDGEPSGVHASEETAVGVLLLRGAGIRKQARLERASALDVLPTLLHMAGLPASQDMPGSVITAAFEGEERTPLPRVEKFQRRAAAADSQGTRSDDAIIERLKALGYMKDAPEQERAVPEAR